MNEIPVLMSKEEFTSELCSLEQIMEREKNLGHGYDRRAVYLIGCVTSDMARIHTPEQLRQIFELAK